MRTRSEKKKSDGLLSDNVDDKVVIERTQSPTEWLEINATRALRYDSISSLIILTRQQFPRASSIPDINYIVSVFRNVINLL